MSLARQVGQLLWVGFDGHDVPDGLRRRIAAGHAGAAVIFARNVVSPPQVRALCDALHAAAPTDAPLLIAVDQEGGRVQRLRAPATEWPPVARLGDLAARSPEGARLAEQLAGRAGQALGVELAALGFDMDFAPVLDVHTNPANPVIGDRAFATTPALVTKLASAFSRGLAEAGVASCGKHFPGHGDTALDSHLALPRVDHPLERLRAIELPPFRDVRPLDAIMTAHVVFGALDPTLPATLSPAALGLLRGELGWDGVVVSDDLEMKAIADHFGIEDAVERGLMAGCDAFLLCHDEGLQLRALEALVRAAERAALVRERVAQAAARVEALKVARAAARRTTAARGVAPDLAVLGAAAHRAVADAIRAS